MPTANLDLTRDVWEPVASGPIDLLLTGSDRFEWTLAAAPPTVKLGHFIEEKTLFPIRVLAGESLYARCSQRDMTLVVDVWRQPGDGGGGGGGGGSTPMTGAEIVAALVLSGVDTLALTAKVWGDLRAAGATGIADPTSRPVPYAAAVTVDDPVGIVWALPPDEVGAGSTPMTGAEIVAALIDPATNIRSLTAAVWQDLAQASSDGPADPASSPVPYLVEATTEYPVGVAWDPSERIFATVEEAAAGEAGLVATLDVEEAVRTAGAPVTWDGAETIDLATSPVVYALLTANSTPSLFLNPRPGADFMIVVENAGAFTVTFSAAPGLQLWPVNTLTAATGAGVRTLYVGQFITETLVAIAKVGP